MTTLLDNPFSAWAGPRKPKILIVGEAWGEKEESAWQPFVGWSGMELWRMLGEAAPEAQGLSGLHDSASGMFRYGSAWIRHREPWLAATGIAFTSVFNLRPPANNLDHLLASKTELKALGKSLGMESQAGAFGPLAPWVARPIKPAKYLRPEYLPQLQRLFSEIILAKPNLILAAGNTACWALLRATNIGAIRGSVAIGACPEGSGLGAFGPKVLPTYHPAGVLRNWSWRPIVVADLMKAFREGEFPEIRRPRREVLVNPTLDEAMRWANESLNLWLAGKAPVLSCDIETGAKQIKCIGFATSRDRAMVIPFVDLSHASGSYWPTPSAEHEAWSIVKWLLESPLPKLFQNGMYDLNYITSLGILPSMCLEDSMLLHHSLHPEMLKGLGFLGSVYSDEASWKLMRRPKADTNKADE